LKVLEIEGVEYSDRVLDTVRGQYVEVRKNVDLLKQEFTERASVYSLGLVFGVMLV
jgi:hypothetical protein